MIQYPDAAAPIGACFINGIELALAEKQFNAARCFIKIGS